MTTYTYTLTVQLPDDDPTDREEMDDLLAQEVDYLAAKWNKDMTPEARVALVLARNGEVLTGNRVDTDAIGDDMTGD